MCRRTSRDWLRTSYPATLAVPAVGGKKHVSIRMVVVLPAPLGPRKPTICPFATEKEMRSTAVLRAYRLVRSVTVIMLDLFVLHPIDHARTVGLRCVNASKG